MKKQIDMENIITVGIVEDIEAARINIEQLLLQSDEFKLFGSFDNAEDAVDFFIRQPADVIIMDINLPGMSGIECVRQIKEKQPQIQILMFTIFEDSERIFEALRAGANGYLLKRTSPNKLLEAIKELHEGGAPMSAMIAKKVVSSFQNQEKSNFNLSETENKILQLLSKGFLYKEVSSKLEMSEASLRKKIHQIYEKLHVNNRTEALNKVFGMRDERG